MVRRIIDGDNLCEIKYEDRNGIKSLEVGRIPTVEIGKRDRAQGKVLVEG